MSDLPTVPPPPPPSPPDREPEAPPVTPGERGPFSGSPQPLPGGGCSKPALIGCGVFFLLLGVVGVIFILRAKDLLSWSLGSLTPAVLQNAAPEVTADDRRRFEAAVAAARRRIEQGRLDPAALQALQARLMAAAQVGAGKLSRPDFLLLTEAFEAMAGGSEAPAPAPEVPGSREAVPEGDPAPAATPAAPGTAP